jgi:predicted Zn-dependent peptidase
MTKRFFLSIVLAALASAQMPQGQQQSVAGVVKLNRAPVSNEVLKVKLPRPVERQLSNGMKLLVVESHRVPTITLRMNMPSGDLRDPASMPGVSDATAALIRLGTKTRSSKDIADAVAELGASLSFGSSQGESTIFLSSMTENFDAALALLADVLLNPTFPQDELDKYKTRLRTQLEQAKSSPGFPANDLLMKLLYPDDSRRYTHPTVESLSKITRESLIEHYKTYYVPSGEWAGISGDISPRDAVAKLDKVLGAWKGGPVAHVTMKFPEPLSEKKVFLIPRPNSVQTLLMVANHAIDRKSPDYLECQVMNRVLGSGPSSRLFRIIREEKGYTYGIGSGFSATRYLNHFTASTSVRTEVTEPALAELLAQFADIRNRAVPADELADAKSAIVASFVLGLESSSQVLSRWMEQRMDGLPEDYWDTYTAKVMAVGAEDVQRVAKKYVPLDNIRIIAVGDATKIAELLKKFGPVEEISPDSM